MLLPFLPYPIVVSALAVFLLFPLVLEAPSLVNKLYVSYFILFSKLMLGSMYEVLGIKMLLEVPFIIDFLLAVPPCRPSTFIDDL